MVLTLTETKLVLCPSCGAACEEFAICEECKGRTNNVNVFDEAPKDSLRRLRELEEEEELLPAESEELSFLRKDILMWTKKQKALLKEYEH